MEELLGIDGRRSVSVHFPAQMLDEIATEQPNLAATLARLGQAPVASFQSMFWSDLEWTQEHYRRVVDGKSIEGETPQRMLGHDIYLESIDGRTAMLLVTPNRESTRPSSYRECSLLLEREDEKSPFRATLWILK